ncbi:MAG: FkbM family methyltransferase, partial [Akkermansiaceae bacterium]|nr:FkbM family methyltransferase [Akkermansiaceae bacterium]
PPPPPTKLSSLVSDILSDEEAAATGVPHRTDDIAPAPRSRRAPGGKLGKALDAKDRFSLLMRRHPFGYALGASISEIARSLFNPAATMSFSQTGEDRFIHYLLDVAKAGFYVDVGCNHPLHKSNTLRLYQRGWRGLCIDGNPELIDLFQRVRPLDNAVCEIVSDEEKEIEFIVAKQTAVSTVSEEHAAEWIGDEGVARRIKTTAKTLTSILDENDVPKDFELLSVDVEGHDLEVMRSLDFHIYRPQVVVCEIHGFDLLHPERSEIYRLLVEAGYTLKGYASFNAFFVRD